MASEFLAAMGSAFSDDLVRQAVNDFHGRGGHATPSLLAKALSSCMASYKGTLLGEMCKHYGPWDCNFARDLLMAVEFDFERSTVAEEIIPFVQDLEQFERVVIGEGCPSLQGYARSNVLGKVEQEVAKRSGSAGVGSTATTHGGGDGSDGSAQFIAPASAVVASPNPTASPTGMAQPSPAGPATADHTGGFPSLSSAGVPVANAAVPVTSSGVHPVLAPVGAAQTTVPQVIASPVPHQIASPVSPRMATPGQQMPGIQTVGQQVRVQIPPGARAGQVIQVRAPNGQTFGVSVPAGAAPGSTIIAQAPVMSFTAAQPVIQPARGNLATNSAVTINNQAIQRARSTENRRRVVMRVVSFIIFIVIASQIISAIVNAHRRNEDANPTFRVISSGDYDCESSGLRTIESITECRSATEALMHSSRLTVYPKSSGVTRVESYNSRNEPSGCFLKVTRQQMTHVETGEFRFASGTSAVACSSIKGQDSFVCLCKE